MKLESDEFAIMALGKAGEGPAKSPYDELVPGDAVHIVFAISGFVGSSPCTRWLNGLNEAEKSLYEKGVIVKRLHETCSFFGWGGGNVWLTVVSIDPSSELAPVTAEKIAQEYRRFLDSAMGMAVLVRTEIKEIEVNDFIPPTTTPGIGIGEWLSSIALGGFLAFAVKDLLLEAIRSRRERRE